MPILARTAYENLGFFVTPDGVVYNYPLTIADVALNPTGSNGGLTGVQTSLMFPYGLVAFNTSSYILTQGDNKTNFDVYFRSEDTPEGRPITLNKIYIVFAIYPLLFNETNITSQVLFYFKLHGILNGSQISTPEMVVTSNNITYSNYTNFFGKYQLFMASTDFTFTAEKPQLEIVSITTPGTSFMPIEIHKVILVTNIPIDETL